MPQHGHIPGQEDQNGFSVKIDLCPDRTQSAHVDFASGRAYCRYGKRLCPMLRKLVIFGDGEQYSMCKLAPPAETEAANLSDYYVRDIASIVDLEDVPGFMRDLTKIVLNKVGEDWGHPQPGYFGIHHGVLVRRALNVFVAKALSLPKPGNWTRTHPEHVLLHTAKSMQMDPNGLAILTKQLLDIHNCTPALSAQAGMKVQEIVNFAIGVLRDETGSVGRGQEMVSAALTQSIRAVWRTLAPKLKAKHGLYRLLCTANDEARQLEINKIEVAHQNRGEGRANAAMKEICAWADRQQVILTLTPTNAFGASKARLTSWYKGLGFVANRGKNADHRFRETMIRLPGRLPP